ncbi:hypothetical protein QFZ33_002424 [Arthrobacter globiformis]|nr:hypothetical protein [Arthrobacter globiformis]
MVTILRRIDFTTPEGKEYELRPAGNLPTIVVRPRGWHLPEKHMLIDGTPIAGGIVNFGLYFFHNARRLLAQGKGPRAKSEAFRKTWVVGQLSRPHPVTSTVWNPPLK